MKLNDHLEYRADDDGSVWVSDVDSNRVIYSGRVLRGDRLFIDPQKHALTLNSPTRQRQPSRDVFIPYEAGGRCREMLRKKTRNLFAFGQGMC